MEWMNRGQGQNQPTGQTVGHSPAPAAMSAKKQKGGIKMFKTMRFAQILLLFSATILMVAVLWFIALGNNTKAEQSYVDDTKLQAVFLNGGQVYFGKIGELNGKYLNMSNIYYLRVNQQVQPNQSTTANANDVSLVKLGCELHGPQDSMVINREQVIFWENLKDDGQVAKAVKDYVAQNPNGQKCDTAPSATGTSDNARPETPVNNNSRN